MSLSLKKKKNHIIFLLIKKMKTGPTDLNTHTSVNAIKKLVEATLLTVLDYGDMLYMHSASLTSLDSVYHALLWFITNANSRTHLCILYKCNCIIYDSSSYDSANVILFLIEDPLGNSLWP